MHKADSTACLMPVLSRAEVDAAALRLFEVVALDVEGTRAHLAGQLDTRAADARAQADRAAMDAAEKQAALARFDRDYAAAILSAENYERLTTDYRAQLAAAEAEHARLSAQADGVADALTGLDPEGVAMQRLAALRVAVAERVSTAATDDIGALRAALAQVFECVSVDRDPDGTLHLHPWLRREVFDGAVCGLVTELPDCLAGVLKQRVPLELEAAGMAKIPGSGSGVPE